MGEALAPPRLIMASFMPGGQTPLALGGQTVQSISPGERVMLRLATLDSHLHAPQVHTQAKPSQAKPSQAKPRQDRTRQAKTHAQSVSQFAGHHSLDLDTQTQ